MSLFDAENVRWQAGQKPESEEEALAWAADPATDQATLLRLHYAVDLQREDAQLERMDEMLRRILANPALTPDGICLLVEDRLGRNHTNDVIGLRDPIGEALATNPAWALWLLSDLRLFDRFPRSTLETLCLTPAMVRAHGEAIAAVLMEWIEKYRASPIGLEDRSNAFNNLRATADLVGGRELRYRLMGPRWGYEHGDPEVTDGLPLPLHPRPRPPYQGDTMSWPEATALIVFILAACVFLCWLVYHDSKAQPAPAPSSLRGVSASGTRSAMEHYYARIEADAKREHELKMAELKGSSLSTIRFRSKSPDGVGKPTYSRTEEGFLVKWDNGHEVHVILVGATPGTITEVVDNG